MNIAVQSCFAQIVRSLQQVVIPELSSDFARGQASAIMHLLDQMEPRIGYRHDLLAEDYDYAREALQVVQQALTRSGVVVPEKMGVSACYGKTGSEIGAPKLREELVSTETAFSESIDLFYESKARIEDFEAVEKKLMGLLMGRVKRDVGLIRPGRYPIITPRDKGDKKE
jgi:hypothetical protein